MRKKMIVRLTNNLEQPLIGVTIDEKGNRISDINHDANEAEVIVIVPGCDVFLTEVKLPKLSSSQLLKAIPYALEEKLMEDAANLHFAIGKNEKDNILPVAVVSKKKMAAWQAILNGFFKQSPHLKMFLPETLALPWKPKEWTILVDKGMGLVRTGAQAGFAVELNELWIILGLLLKHPDTLLPQSITIFGELEIPLDEADFLKKLNISILQQSENDLFTLMATTSDHLIGIDLLQGPYKIHHVFAERKIFYRLAIILVTTWLLVLTFGYAVQFSILQYREHQLHKLVMARYLQVFPNATLVSDNTAKQRMQQTLQTLKNAHKENIFLSMLSNIAPTISQATGIKLLGMEYTSNKLILKIETNDFALLDNLSQALKAPRYKIEIVEAIKSGDHIRANLIIKEMTE
jgi:general secretion pathway protein L